MQGKGVGLTRGEGGCPRSSKSDRGFLELNVKNDLGKEMGGGEETGVNMIESRKMVTN